MLFCVNVSSQTSHLNGRLLSGARVLIVTFGGARSVTGGVAVRAGGCGVPGADVGSGVDVLPRRCRRVRLCWMMWLCFEKPTLHR